MVPVVVCPSMLARKSRWSPDHWFLNKNKRPLLNWASLRLACRRRSASALPRRWGRLTTIGWDIYDCSQLLLHGGPYREAARGLKGHAPASGYAVPDANRGCNKFAKSVELTRLGNTRVGPAGLGCLRVEPGPRGFRQFAAGLRTAENVAITGGALA